MLRVVFHFLILLISIISCNYPAKKDIPRSDIPAKRIIADHLFTRFPGTLQVTSDRILLQDPFNSDGFLRIYDRKSGEESGQAGVIGRGPGEWNSPDIGNVIHDRVVIYDSHLKQFVMADANNQYRDISNPDSIRKTGKDILKLNCLDPHRFIIANWKETHPFEIYITGNYTACGQYPLKENIKNAMDCFQGNILLHPRKKLLLYATFDNPYVAMYRIENDKLNLVWENQFKPPRYTVMGGLLKWDSDHPHGVSDIAFTKDYVIALVKDFKSDARGRDVQAAPKAIYVFDYKGRLVRIFDLPVHSVRLASDADTNIFYSVGLEPDYCIVEYEMK